MYQTTFKGIIWDTKNLLTLKKPKYIDDEHWLKIKSLVSMGYVTQQMLKTREYFNESDIQKRVKEQKPDLVKDFDWSEYANLLKKLNV